MRTTITLLLAIVLFASCNQYKKTPSGFAYKITKGDGKVQLKNGMFIKFNIEYKLPSKDSILISSYGHIPAYTVIDTSRAGKHNFMEIITQCAVGDKMEFAMSIDTLQKLGMIQYNNEFKPKDLIKGRVEFLKSFATQEEAMADGNKEREIELTREKKELADYVAKKGGKTQSTPAGVLYEITTPGDASVKIDTGKVAQVRYRVTTTDGKLVDTNTDPKGPNTMPLMVTIGAHGVIPGLEEALKFFNKGSKGKVYIPAMLAYGENGNPPVVPRYANLVFDVEVADVTPAAAPAQAPPPVPTPKK